MLHCCPCRPCVFQEVEGVRREPLWIQHQPPMPPQGAAQAPAAAIAGRISLVRSSKRRSLDISLEHCPLAADGTRGASITALYDLAVSSAAA